LVNYKISIKLLEDAQQQTTRRTLLGSSCRACRNLFRNFFKLLAQSKETVSIEFRMLIGQLHNLCPSLSSFLP
jgi:hypothetical protein